MAITPGLYEQIVTAGLQKELAALWPKQVVGSSHGNELILRNKCSKNSAKTALIDRFYPKTAPLTSDSPAA